MSTSARSRPSSHGGVRRTSLLAVSSSMLLSSVLAVSDLSFFMTTSTVRVHVTSLPSTLVNCSLTCAFTRSLFTSCGVSGQTRRGRAPCGVPDTRSSIAREVGLRSLPRLYLGVVHERRKVAARGLAGRGVPQAFDHCLWARGDSRTARGVHTSAPGAVSRGM